MEEDKVIHEKMSVAGTEESPAGLQLSDASVEQAAICGPEQSRSLQSTSEQVLSFTQSVVFPSKSSSDNDRRLEFKPRTPTRVDEGSTAVAAATDEEEVEHGGPLELLAEQSRGRDQAGQPDRRLAEHDHNGAIDGGQLETCGPEEPEKYIQILPASSTGQLRSRSQEKLAEVEEEWEAFLAMKQEAAVAALSRRLGKKVARSKVQSVLATERLQQNGLTKLRLTHFKLRFRIQRLQAELRGLDERGEDTLQVQFDQVRAEVLERRKQAKEEIEDSLKLQKKIRSCLEVLSNVKEKLRWSQTEVQAKRQQLAEAEDLVAKKRNLLTQTKLARNNLERDNQRLRERCGLLGNRDLLLDFEETVDSSENLEKHLEKLKSRHAALTYRRETAKQKSEAYLTRVNHEPESRTSATFVGLEHFDRAKHLNLVGSDVTLSVETVINVEPNISRDGETKTK